MRWIAIGATVENIVVAAHDDIVLMEAVSEYDFDVIVKIYGVSDLEYDLLKKGSWDCRIRFNNVRSVWLEPITRSSEIETRSQTYVKRLQGLAAMRARFEHAMNKHRTLLSQQSDIYAAKIKEALDILSNPSSPYLIDGYVNDYAEEAGLEILTAATLVIAKWNGQHEHLRKIERLRLRHFKSIKKANTDAEFDAASAALDKDLFINMLM